MILSSHNLILLVGIIPHAVRKRTPRVNISYADKDNNKYFSPAKQNLKLNMDATNDDVAREIAIVLTEASQRGGSPQISPMCTRKAEGPTPSPLQNGGRMVIFNLLVVLCSFL